MVGQLNVENLAGNRFINFGALILTDLPSAFIGAFFINRIGRRWSQVGGHLLTAIFYGSIVIFADDPSLTGLVTGFAIAAKTLSNTCWYINFVQMMELFPTTSRVSGITTCTVFSTAFGVVSPYVVGLVSES